MKICQLQNNRLTTLNNKSKVFFNKEIKGGGEPKKKHLKINYFYLGERKGNSFLPVMYLKTSRTTQKRQIRTQTSDEEIKGYEDQIRPEINTHHITLYECMMKVLKYEFSNKDI